MSKPKKLIRKEITKLLRPEEFEVVNDPKELNELYRLKMLEEIEEIKNSNFQDPKEFVDLIQVTIDCAYQNGCDKENLHELIAAKALDKGVFSNIVLNNLNPGNPSNKIYFEITETDIALKSMHASASNLIGVLQNKQWERLPNQLINFQFAVTRFEEVMGHLLSSRKSKI